MNGKTIPIACDMEAFTPEQRRRHSDLSEELRQTTEEVKELSNGYAFRYKRDENTWMRVAEYVDLERRCCPFFSFDLKREAESGDVWLSLTGREGVRAFLAEQIERS